MLDRFYPVVPDAEWVTRLVSVGTRLVQLRIKDQPADEIRRQVGQAKAACAAAGAQLIVNDYWQAAIDEGCDYVHLGQEDGDLFGNRYRFILRLFENLPYSPSPFEGFAGFLIKPCTKTGKGFQFLKL